MPTLRVWILTDDSAQEKWKGFTRKLEEKLACRLPMGTDVWAFHFLRNSCLLIKERRQKYSSQPAHHSGL